MKKQFLFSALPLIQWTAFVDTYYAWDFNRPTEDRVYTTQPMKHNAVSLNMAMLGMKLEQGNKRAVLTFQHGDSVDVNYAGEPNKGEGIKHIQEAYAGIKLPSDIWIDAGIYLGHIGNESWISRDNWTYSRSLHSDYVPYYTSGVRVSGKDWQLHFMNGWQNIRENNQGKAVGGQYVWRQDSYTLSYNFQVGHELFPNRATSGLRTYQNTNLEMSFKNFSWKAAVDVGSQRVPNSHQNLVWGATSSQWRWNLSEMWKQAVRIEYFHDQKGAINPTGTEGGFRVVGISTNVDYEWESGALARAEVRSFKATDRIYPSDDGLKDSETFIVLSMGVGF